MHKFLSKLITIQFLRIFSSIIYRVKYEILVITVITWDLFLVFIIITISFIDWCTHENDTNDLIIYLLHLH